jgi:hypothetical protein
VRKVVALLLLAAVLTPPNAVAKEGIERLRVCGVSACRTIDDEQLIGPLVAGLLGTNPRPHPPPVEFFTLVPEPTAGWPHTWPRFLYAPEAQLVRQTDGRGGTDWYPLIWTAGAYPRATEGLAPFPEPLAWSELKTPAARPTEWARLKFAVGATVTVAALGFAAIAALRRRTTPLPT